METDVILIGAGPIGLETACALKHAGVDYIHLEAGQIGQTIYDWPRHARFFSSPERVAIAGIPVQTHDQEQLIGEVYLAYLRSVVEIYDLDIHLYEPVTAIERSDTGFVVTSNKRGTARNYRSRYLVLATGDMNTPNRLGIPGEELPHVSHRFDEPHRYFRQKLLVVGGRNSALEAALRCFRAGAYVSLSYRRPYLDSSRTNSRLHLELSILTRKNYIPFYPSTVPVAVGPEHVDLGPSRYGGASKRETGLTRVDADFVLLLTGFQGQVEWLKNLGAGFHPESEIPKINEATMETSVPGLFVAGTAVSGNQQSYKVFVATAHEHGPKIVRAITGTSHAPFGTVPSRRYPFTIQDIASKDS